MKVAFYVRVSTGGQTVENQLAELGRVAEMRGWEVVRVYRDDGVSGSKGRDARPGFDEFCRDLREYDMVAVWSIDRLGRSLKGLLSFLEDVKESGVDLYVHRQSVDTSTPAGRMMFNMLGVFAEYEREMISERTVCGLERARAGGSVLGRPATIGVEVKERAVSLVRGGMSVRDAARECGVSKSVVGRLVAMNGG